MRAVRRAPCNVGVSSFALRLCAELWSDCVLQAKLWNECASDARSSAARACAEPRLETVRLMAPVWSHAKILGLRLCAELPMYTHLVVQICYTFVRVSIVVSISACHADDPGSIPGRGNSEGDLFQALGRMLLTVVLAFRKTFIIQANVIPLLIDPNRSCHASMDK